MYIILKSQKKDSNALPVDKICEMYNNSKPIDLSGYDLYIEPMCEDVENMITYKANNVLTEVVVTKGASNDQIISKLMENLDIKDEKQLIIIDPYFLKGGRNNQNLLVVLGKLFSKIPSIETVQIICNGKRDFENEVKTVIEKTGKKVIISQQATDEFHDRFWILPDTNRGIIVGTSLNGLGNKICIVSKLDRDDVVEILKIVDDRKL